MDELGAIVERDAEYDDSLEAEAKWRIAADRRYLLGLLRSATPSSEDGVTTRERDVLSLIRGLRIDGPTIEAALDALGPTATKAEAVVKVAAQVAASAVALLDQDAILAATPDNAGRSPIGTPPLPDPDAPLHVLRAAAADLSQWTADRLTDLGFGCEIIVTWEARSGERTAAHVTTPNPRLSESTGSETMNEPRTEAGRALLADAPDLIDLNDDVLSRDGLRQVILAIEAEAARTADRPSLREAILNGIDERIRPMEWPNGMADRVIGAIDAALRQALEGEDR